MIRHTVVFRLKHLTGSVEQADFLAAARDLANIPGVGNFECLRQIGAKSNYRFGLSMEFADHAVYSAYDNHPDHTAFVRDRWIPEVAAFLELDFAPMT
jgi:hypothetical protein